MHLQYGFPDVRVRCDIHIALNIRVEDCLVNSLIQLLGSVDLYGLAGLPHYQIDTKQRAKIVVVIDNLLKQIRSES